MAQFVNYLAGQGLTLADKLEQLYESYGFHCTDNSYYICKSQETIDEIFGAMRKVRVCDSV